MSILKLAIISDMHCMHSANEKLGGISTYLHTDDIGKSETRHPIKALNKLIETEELLADLLLCPGDIANLADKQGLITGWSFLQKIRRKINAKHIIATVGNHDIENRNENVGNVFLDLQLLDEDYPIPKALNDANYWSNGYSFVEIDEVIILNINSCFFQSNATTAKKSKIDISQLEAIKKELTKKRLDKFVYRVVLIHHHPIAHSNLDYEDIDKLDKGEELIELMNQYKFQMIIHGHKHDARLTIVNSLPVFCAGSFSSLMNVTDLKSDNTFHIVHLNAGENKGYIKSWIYAPQEGWVKRSDVRFPCFTGFGFKGNLSDLAHEISDWLASGTTGGMSYYEPLIESFPDLLNLGKDDQVNLSAILAASHNLEFHPKYPNKPNVIIKAIK